MNYTLDLGLNLIGDNQSQKNIVTIDYFNENKSVYIPFIIIYATFGLFGLKGNF